eukprot:812008-Pyramimonas_sp.AAC.1
MALKVRGPLGPGGGLGRRGESGALWSGRGLASFGRAAGRFSRCMGTPGARGALGKPAAGS